MKKKITRREFLGVAASVTGAAVLASCAPSPTATPAPTTAPTKVPTKPPAPTAVPPPTAVPKLVNALGVELPADAAPLNKQVYIDQYQQDGKYHDDMLSIYDRMGRPDQTESSLTYQDENYEVKPCLATEWTAASDITWRFKIREGQKFSDGQPITARTVEKTMKYAFDGSKRVYDFWWMFMPIKNAEACSAGKVPAEELGVKALDDSTVEFTTDGPCPYMPLIATAIRVSPIHLYEKYNEFANAMPETAVSSGPWKLASRQRGVETSYALNPAYTGPQNLKPMIAGYRSLIGTAESGALMAAFLAGEVPVTKVGGYHMTASRSDMDLVNGEYKDRAQPDPEYVTYYLGLNSIDDKYPFKGNLKLRQAFAHGVDVAGLVNTVLKGQAEAATSMLPPGFAGANPTLLKGYYAYDPAKAKDLMAQAGYANGKGFPKLTVTLRDPSASVIALAEAATKQLMDNLNIGLEIQKFDYPTFASKIKHDLPLYIVPYGMDYYDQSNMMTIWNSGGRHPWKSEAYDVKIKEANTNMQGAKVRDALYWELEKMLVDDVAAIFLCHPLGYLLVGKNVRGPILTPNKFGYSSRQGLYSKNIYFAA